MISEGQLLFNKFPLLKWGDLELTESKAPFLHPFFHLLDFQLMTHGFLISGAAIMEHLAVMADKRK